MIFFIHKRRSILINFVIVCAIMLQMYKYAFLICYEYLLLHIVPSLSLNIAPSIQNITVDSARCSHHYPCEARLCTAVSFGGHPLSQPLWGWHWKRKHRLLCKEILGGKLLDWMIMLDKWVDRCFSVLLGPDLQWSVQAQCAEWKGEVWSTQYW